MMVIIIVIIIIINITTERQINEQTVSCFVSSRYGPKYSHVQILSSYRFIQVNIV